MVTYLKKKKIFHYSTTQNYFTECNDFSLISNSICIHYQYSTQQTQCFPRTDTRQAKYNFFYHIIFF